MDWVYLTHDGDRWRALVNLSNFLTSPCSWERCFVNGVDATSDVRGLTPLNPITRPFEDGIMHLTWLSARS